MADTRSVHETRFEAAVKVIQSLPKNGRCLGHPLPPHSWLQNCSLWGQAAWEPSFLLSFTSFYPS